MSNRTKLWIAENMRTLLQRKPIEKIRVTELCTLAQIERPTFYYHFQDKYDLMAWMLFPKNPDLDIIDLHSSARAMDEMKKDFILFKRAYEDTSQAPMWEYMLHYFIDQHTKLALNKLDTRILNEDIKFSIRFYCYGALGISREWVLYDNITSSKQIVEMIFNSMPQNLKEIYFQ